MQQFKYVIKDELGIHARPAGMLVKAAKPFKSSILVSKDGNKVEATKLIMLMNLGVKKGDEITVTVEGIDEGEASTAIQTFFTENL